MKITYIEATHGFTANIGNYNNTKFELAMGADLEPGEDADAAFKQLDEKVASIVAGKRRAIAEYLSKKHGEGK